MVRAALAVVAVSSALGISAPAAPTARKVVERSGHWVEQFEHDFISVVADEQYDQFASSGTDTSHRQIRSELLFLRPETGESWVAVRNVLSYVDDGERPIDVPNSRDRLERVLAGGRLDGRTALRRLADESARFNIGDLARNFNTPTLALQFLDDAHRDRFKFRLEGSEVISSDEVWRLAYQEREHPTIIQANFRDTELVGHIWTRASDGAVVRTRLELTAKPRAGYSGLLTIVTVEYTRDEKLARLVPASMQEEYVERGGEHHVSGTALYSNYRVFETSARIISSQ
ncbi:MAG TPA: hypothetical protein VLV86_08935 [Vicinamibacterales bacterium]|nr:hypothetical protein [Vicinamibacterales bacterium]